MMGHRGARGGDEQDAFSPYWRRLMRWRPGVLRRIKRGYAKRVRRAERERLKRDDQNA